MSAFVPGPRRPACAFAAAVASAFLLGACASSGGYPSYPSGVGAAQPAAMPVPAKPFVPEIEADGLPVQTAPFRQTTPIPDDPSEPFSPNYGSRQRPATVPANKGQDAAAPVVNQGRGPRIVAWRPLSPREQDAVMKRAIEEHERRNP